MLVSVNDRPRAEFARAELVDEYRAIRHLAVVVGIDVQKSLGVMVANKQVDASRFEFAQSLRQALDCHPRDATVILLLTHSMKAGAIQKHYPGFLEFNQSKVIGEVLVADGRFAPRKQWR